MQHTYATFNIYIYIIICVEWKTVRYLFIYMSQRFGTHFVAIFERGKLRSGWKKPPTGHFLSCVNVEVMLNVSPPPSFPLLQTFR